MIRGTTIDIGGYAWAAREINRVEAQCGADKYELNHHHPVTFTVVA